MNPSPAEIPGNTPEYYRSALVCRDELTVELRQLRSQRLCPERLNHAGNRVLIFRPVVGAGTVDQHTTGFLTPATRPVVCHSVGVRIAERRPATNA